MIFIFFFLWVYVSIKDISVTPNVSDQPSGGLFCSGISDSIVYFFSFVLRTGADGSNYRSPLMREYSTNAAGSRSKLSLTENISLT